jgi:hypothetical protein
MQNINVLSVMTRPDITTNDGLVRIIADRISAFLELYSRLNTMNMIPTRNIPNKKCGNLAVNSLIPKILNEAAVNQNDNGGFAKKGKSGSTYAVIKSLLSTIRIAMPAYLASVVSFKSYEPSDIVLSNKTRNIATQHVIRVLLVKKLPEYKI